MKDTQEILTIAAFVGKPIRQETLDWQTDECRKGSGRYADCMEYSIRLPVMPGEELTMEPGSETAEQDGKLQNVHARLTLVIYMKDGILAGGHVSKRLICELLPGGYETEPSIRDLQLAQCILKTITDPSCTFAG